MCETVTKIKLGHLYTSVKKEEQINTRLYRPTGRTFLGDVSANKGLFMHYILPLMLLIDKYILNALHDLNELTPSQRTIHTYAGVFLPGNR